MNFNFDNLVIWLKNGEIRNVKFEANKVNVITGDSGTGKSAILEIIDYCFFASSHRISEGVINENVDWYGLVFSINSKKFTLGRKAPNFQIVSDDYYFSPIGEIPSKPHFNNTESALKNTLEVEFGINDLITMKYGSANIAANSKISLRYFMLFNTVSQDIIENSDVYFDKQSLDRYREALPRVFDLAVGIDDLKNILNRERKEYLEYEIRKAERREQRTTVKKSEFQSEISDLMRQATEYGLLQSEAGAKPEVSTLINMVNSEIDLIKTSKSEGTSIDSWTKEFDKLTNQLYSINTQIRNLERFNSEYKDYKLNLKDAEDSIKPIVFLKQKNNELVKTSIYDEIITSLENDLLKIKEAVKNKTPIDAKVSEVKQELEKKSQSLKNAISSLGEAPKAFENNVDKYLFIGELKAKLSLYGGPEVVPTVTVDTKSDYERELEGIEVVDVTSQKEFFIKMVEEIIQSYMTLAKDALANYGTYQPVFNFRDKKLQLRKPKTDFIENVGSSSNYMFMHLFFFLGLHEVILRKRVPFVPSFLILDQISRPYYGGNSTRKVLLKDSDESKIRKAFELLNAFINTVKNDLNQQFQMIVFEHVPKETWEGLENVILVEEFQNGNALIPNNLINI